MEKKQNKQFLAICIPRVLFCLLANHAHSKQVQLGSGPANGCLRQRHREGLQSLQWGWAHLHINGQSRPALPLLPSTFLLLITLSCLLKPSKQPSEHISVYCCSLALSHTHTVHTVRHGLAWYLSCDLCAAIILYWHLCLNVALFLFFAEIILRKSRQRATSWEKEWKILPLPQSSFKCSQYCCLAAMFRAPFLWSMNACVILLLWSFQLTALQMPYFRKRSALKGR